MGGGSALQALVAALRLCALLVALLPAASTAQAVGSSGSSSSSSRPAAAAGSSSSSTGQQWARQDGQWLADAVQAWGRSNTDSIVLLPSWTIVELQNATFPQSHPNADPALDSRVPVAAVSGTPDGAPSDTSTSSTKPWFSNGTLVLIGDRSAPAWSTSSVIDTGQRAGLVPPITTASIFLCDVALVNTCLQPAPVMGLEGSSSLVLGIFSLSPALLTLAGNRSIVYASRSNLGWLAYVKSMCSGSIVWDSGEAPRAPLVAMSVRRAMPRWSSAGRVRPARTSCVCSAGALLPAAAGAVGAAADV